MGKALVYLKVARSTGSRTVPYYLTVQSFDETKSVVRHLAARRSYFDLKLRHFSLQKGSASTIIAS